MEKPQAITLPKRLKGWHISITCRLYSYRITSIVTLNFLTKLSGDNHVTLINFLRSNVEVTCQYKTCIVLAFRWFLNFIGVEDIWVTNIFTIFATVLIWVTNILNGILLIFQYIQSHNLLNWLDSFTQSHNSKDWKALLHLKLGIGQRKFKWNKALKYVYIGRNKVCFFETCTNHIYSADGVKCSPHVYPCYTSCVEGTPKARCNKTLYLILINLIYVSLINLI